MKKEKKNSRLRLFDITRDGKGLSKTPENRSGLKRFFRTLWDNLGKIVSTNIFMVVGNFPLIFLIIVLAGHTKLETFIPMTDFYQNFDGIIADVGPTPFTMALYSLEGLQYSILVPTTTTYVFYCLGALMLFTFGIVNVGTAYILRNIAMGEPVFPWNDFWYAVKRNWKQAFPFGIIDGIINVLLILNIYTMISGGSFITSMLFWCNVIIFVLYFSMRPYIYVQMLTFKLSVFKIIKNSLIFSIVGLKRNLVAIIGVILGLILELAFLFGFGGILIPFAVAAPLAIMFATFAYMKVYAAYFKIEEVMIIPYKLEHPELYPDGDDSELVMRDDVTERERLREIKKSHGMDE